MIEWNKISSNKLTFQVSADPSSGSGMVLWKRCSICLPSFSKTNCSSTNDRLGLRQSDVDSLDATSATFWVTSFWKYKTDTLTTVSNICIFQIANHYKRLNTAKYDWIERNVHWMILNKLTWLLMTSCCSTYTFMCSSIKYTLLLCESWNNPLWLPNNRACANDHCVSMLGVRWQAGASATKTCLKYKGRNLLSILQT